MLFETKIWNVQHCGKVKTSKKKEDHKRKFQTFDHRFSMHRVPLHWAKILRTQNPFGSSSAGSLYNTKPWITFTKKVFVQKIFIPQPSLFE